MSDQPVQLEYVRCNICGSDDTTDYMRLTDRFTQEVFQLVVCNVCGLIYVNPRPGIEQIDRYYPSEYEPHSVEASNFDDYHFRQMWKMQLKMVERHSGQRGALLDVGCATGEFLAVARSAGWTVEGVELSEEAASRARSRHDLRVITGPIESAQIEKETYDVITMWNVLEHLANPRGAIMKCHESLKKNGLLIFSVPNLSSFNRYLFSESWLGWEVPRHLYYFDEQSLGRLLTDVGFDVIETKCILGDRGVFEISLETMFADSRAASLVNALSPLLLNLTWPYRQLAYLLERGSIITYVVRKKSVNANVEA